MEILDAKGTAVCEPPSDEGGASALPSIPSRALNPGPCVDPARSPHPPYRLASGSQTPCGKIQ